MPNHNPENDSTFEKLKHIGELPDNEIDLAHTALLLASINHPGLTLQQYQSHLKKLVDETARQYDLLTDNEADDITLYHDSLNAVIHEQNSYFGDHKNYDDLQNADLIRVIDRRKGMPISLCILHIHVARSLGWSCDGLNIPGHFLVRLNGESDRLIYDPFNDCKIMEAHNIRELLKTLIGPNAELSNDYFNPADNRTILIRLQNNIKIRQIEHEDYKSALLTVESMRAIAPNEYRLLLDAGVLYARTNSLTNATNALEEYIEKAPDQRDRQEAAILLQEIRSTIN